MSATRRLAVILSDRRAGEQICLGARVWLWAHSRRAAGGHPSVPWLAST